MSFEIFGLQLIKSASINGISQIIFLFHLVKFGDGMCCLVT